MDARTLFLLGARHHQTGNLDKAMALYRQALDADPMMGDAALYLGLALQQNGLPDEALGWFERAVSLLPRDVDALNGLGAVCFEMGEIDRAREAHQAALDINPLSAEGMAGLANVHLSTGAIDLAIKLYHKGLAVAPDSPDLLTNLGVALKTAGRPREAVETLEKALTLNPESTDILYNLGNAWQERGDMAQARACFDKAGRIDPESVSARWGGCFAQLDMLYDTGQQIEAAREHYAASLDRLDRFLTLDSQDQIIQAARAVGGNQPFYLTYQGQNDRELQERYGNLVGRIMRAAYPQFAFPQFDPPSQERIRVGIASGFFHEHSVWKIPTRGWVHHLDRERFEVFGYYTGTKEDHCTADARQRFDRFFKEAIQFESLCQRILDDRLDVLIYPDIGMDPLCAKLGGLRLAPVQCVSLGHPMTTGLPDMDHFLSSDLMEPGNGDDAYTENLVRLPNLGVHYTPLRTGPPLHDRAHFGLPEDALLYLCPQSLFKYLPQYDRMYPEIALQVAGCRFVFIESGRADRLNERFKARLGRCFTDHGLAMDQHVTFLPYQAPEEYHALNCVCDVFLDSIEWSGFNTAMEAANAGLPAVILPKGHMRGHHSYAVQTCLGCRETIGRDLDHAIGLAVRMGTHDAFRQQMRIKTEAGRDTLFRDMEAIRGLETFLESVVRQG